MPETTVPIFQNYDFYVPAFEVKIKGKSLDREVIRDVMSVSYTDSLDKLDSCQLTLNNWDAEKRTFKYSDQEIFDPGEEVEIYMGYHDRGGLTLMLRGQIVSLEPDFPAGGQPTLQVRALNQLYKLHFKTIMKVFDHGETDSQIAQAILDQIMQAQNAQRSGNGKPPLNLELETRDANRDIEESHPYEVINNQYPIIYLMERARRNGYDLFIEEVTENGNSTSKLHFHPPDRGQPTVYELAWGKSLISFKPTLRTIRQVAKVTVNGWNPAEKKPVTGVATRNDLKFRDLPSSQDLSAVDSALAGSEEVVTEYAIETETEANARAKGYLAEIAKGLVTGSGTVVGLPELRAGAVVYLRNLGNRYSGRYRVTNTTHAIGDGGYTTQFQARMEILRNEPLS